MAWICNMNVYLFTTWIRLLFATVLVVLLVAAPAWAALRRRRRDRGVSQAQNG